MNHGMVCTNKEISGTDHFELVEKLKDEEYELTQVRSCACCSSYACDSHTAFFFIADDPEIYEPLI